METKINTPTTFDPGTMELLFKLIDPSDLPKFAQIIERSKVEKELLILKSDITNLEGSREEINKAIIQKQDGVILLTKVLNYQSGDEKDDESKPLSGRNRAVYDFIKKRNNWVYRAEIEEELDDIKLNKMRLEAPDKVYEETRQILRRAKETQSVITKPVYLIGPKSKRVTETYMYGIKDFENNAEYESLFVKKVEELGLFRTKKEAEQSKQLKTKALNGQMQLEDN